MTTINVVSGANAPPPEMAEKQYLIFNVGTRKSKLALKQTDMVLLEAVQAFPQYSFSVKARDTAAGDIDKVTPFKDMPVKNIWTHELETMMIEKQLDFLVHALKGTVLAMEARTYVLTSTRRAHTTTSEL